MKKLELRNLILSTQHLYLCVIYFPIVEIDYLLAHPMKTWNGDSLFQHSTIFNTVLFFLSLTFTVAAPLGQFRALRLCLVLKWIILSRIA